MAAATRSDSGPERRHTLWHHEVRWKWGLTLMGQSPAAMLRAIVPTSTMIASVTFGSDAEALATLASLCPYSYA